MGQGHAVAPGARREAAGDRHRALDAHVGHVGILAGGRDFAEDEERPVGFDLHRHRGIADIAAAQFAGDLSSQARRRPSARRHRADQRHGDGAAGIDRVGVGEAVLAIDHDPQFVAGIEPIGRIMGRRHRRGGVGDGNRRRGHGVGLAVGHRVEVALRLAHRDRPGSACMQPDKASAASRQTITARTPRIGQSMGSIDSD